MAGEVPARHRVQQSQEVMRESGSKGAKALGEGAGEPSQPLFTGQAAVNCGLCFHSCSRCGGHRAKPGSSVAQSSRAASQYSRLLGKLLLYKGTVPQAVSMATCADIPEVDITWSLLGHQRGHTDHHPVSDLTCRAIFNRWQPGPMRLQENSMRTQPHWSPISQTS